METLHNERYKLANSQKWLEQPVQREVHDIY